VSIDPGNPWWAHRQLLAREAVLSALINMALAGSITWLRFGGDAQVPVWGLSGLVADAVPSTVLPVLLMTMAITLIARRRQRMMQSAGAPLARCRSRLRHAPSGVIARALALATLALAVVLPATALGFSLFDAPGIRLTAAVTLKLAQAAMLGVVLGPVAVICVLSEAGRPPDNDYLYEDCSQPVDQ
jgi:hypothetical protein